MRRVLIIFAVILSSFGFLRAQNKSKKIFIDLHSKPLHQILDSISSQSGYYFVFNPKQINPDQKVTLIAHNLPLDVILNQLGDKLNLTYTFVAKQIILKPAPLSTNQKNKNKVQEFIIYGYVTDSATGEPLIGANIFVDGKLTAITNETGYFSALCPKGKHLVKINYIGYKTFSQVINIKSKTNLSIKLSLAPLTLDIILVTAQNNNQLHNNQLEYQSYTRQLILHNPSLAGSFDALKSLQAIAGLNFYGDGSLIFHLRGSLRSQNQILIDDTQIFNPVHLLGFFSAVSPYAISQIKVYKNLIPVQYTEASAGVVDIKLRDGDYKKFQALVNLNPILNSYMLSGPALKKGKSSFLATLRHSNYLNIFYENKQSLLKIGFLDFQSKINFKLSTKNRLSSSIFLSSDKLALTREFIASNIWWNNLASTFRWTHFFSNRTVLKTVLFTSNYSYFLKFQPDTTNIFNSHIFKTGFKTDLMFLHSPNTWRVGMKFNYYYFNPANINDYAYLPSQNAIENTFYIGNELYLGKKFKISSGLDIRFFANVGPTYLNYYNDLHQYITTDTIGPKIYNYFIHLSPRIEASYKITPKWIISTSFGKYVQYLQLISNSISPFTTVEAWLPSNPTIPAIETYQIAAGINKSTDVLNFSLEAYYKHIDNFVVFSNFSSLLFNPYIESQLRYGHAVSSGIELSLHKIKGKFNFWLAYSYSRTFFNIPELWQNIWYPAEYDKPNNLYFNSSYNFSRLQLGMVYIFSSGNRFTAPVGFYDILDHKVPIYQLPNNAQMPYYSRLDFFFRYKLNRRNHPWSHYLTLSIFNALNRKNPVLVSFNKIKGQDNFFYVPSNFIYEYQITPSFYYLFKTIPMISYTIKFN